jgi:hypothetical protein
MGRRQRAYLRKQGLPTHTPKPPPRRYPDSPRPFTEPWVHVTEAWNADAALNPRFSYRGRITWRIITTPIVALLSFLGFGYGRWWRERR